MLINYLCTKHADWVYNNPEQALHVMARDEMQGTMLMQRGQLSEAIPILVVHLISPSYFLKLMEAKTAL